MAKLHTRFILYTISLLAIFFSCTHARTNIISMPGSGSSNPTTQEWLRAFKVQEGETLTELHLFIQDNTSGPKKTVYNVAESPVTSTSPTYFGRTQVVDHQITTGPGSDSPQVGRLQGIHLLADLHQVALTVNWNIIFTDGPYKGSTLTVLGRLPSLETEGELSIVSGTGTFLLARGIVLKKTYAIDPATYNMVLEFRLFVTTPKVQRFLPSRASVAMRCKRPFSTDLPAETAADSKFVDAWKKMNPNMDPPKTPSAYMKPRPPTPSTIPSKLTVNLVLPYDSVLSGKQVDMVIVPATTGQMGVLPGHVSTIAELKPGILSVHEGNDISKYFLSGGFTFVHANSIADIIAIEATPLDRIDQNLVQKGLAEFQQKLNSASTEAEKAEAQIGVDVHSALIAALTG